MTRLFSGEVGDKQVDILWDADHMPCHLSVVLLRPFRMQLEDSTFPNAVKLSAVLQAELMTGPARDFLHDCGVDAASRLWNLNHNGWAPDVRNAPAEPCPVARLPLDDREADAERVAAYWSWLERYGKEAARQLQVPQSGSVWVRLQTEKDADWEASWMRHSIGHSWTKYSGYGDIWSLRQDGVPQATVLVSGNRIIHAREHSNSRLSAENQAELELWATEHGYVVVPDPYPFTPFSGDGQNTKLTLMRRGAEGKAWANIIVAGRFGDEDVAQLATFILENGGLDCVGDLARVIGGDGALELVTLAHSDEEPNSNLAWDTLMHDVRGLAAASETPRLG